MMLSSWIKTMRLWIKRLLSFWFIEHILSSENSNKKVLTWLYLGWQQEPGDHHQRGWGSCSGTSHWPWPCLSPRLKFSDCQTPPPVREVSWTKPVCPSWSKLYIEPIKILREAAQKNFFYPTVFIWFWFCITKNDLKI